MAPPSLTGALDGDVKDGSVVKACSISLQDGQFLASGHPFLVDVPSNVVATPASAVVAPSASGGGKGDAVSVSSDVLASGCFVGFDVPDGEAKSWVAAPLGRLVGIPFMSIFRFKVWWTTHWVGSRGRDLEHETQLLLLDKGVEEGKDGSAGGLRPYVLVVPMIEGPFRACLRHGTGGGDDDDNVEVVVESGSSKVRESRFRGCVYMHAGSMAGGGDDPFSVVKEAMRVVRAHLGTFKLLEEKTPPGIVDKLGWCTWDAFYLKVHPTGVWEGVKGLVDGGCPPGLVLIDDGWQSICHDEDDPGSGTEGMNRTSAGEQMPCRLVKFAENYKFRDYCSSGGGKGMGAFTRDLKSAFPSVTHVYVWHALCGYWGGLRPGVAGLPEARVVQPKLTPGLETTMDDLAVHRIVNNGVGLVTPEKAALLFEGLHSHLAASGIDGVKVDVIHLLEMLCEEYGGRVELARAYYSALTDSVWRHFKGNGVIASMEHCNDFMLLGTEAIALGRVGDDFWCTDPSGDPSGQFWLQGCHMVHCAYNSLWMGNFIQPDWDMFQSVHPCAEFHAASRAVSGGPIYVSDTVGQHDFRLLKALGLPDGTVLRCEAYALPTRDCLFVDPLHDGRTMLKIWNLNKFTGVLGAFNCQGGGWCRQTRRTKCFANFSHRITTVARPSDIEWTTNKPSAPIDVDDHTSFAVYWYRQGKLQLLGLQDGVQISLDPFNFELLTVSPVRTLPGAAGITFAPIGLVNMLNTGGAIQDLRLGDHHVDVAVRGAGEFKAFSSHRPHSCSVDARGQVDFAYDDHSHVVTVQVAWPGSSDTLTTLHYSY